MKRSRLFWDLFLPYAVGSALLSLLFILWGTAVQERAVQQVLRERLTDIAHTVALQEFITVPPDQAAARLNTIARVTGVRLAVSDSSGTVLADTAADPNLEASRKDDPVIRDAIRSGVGSAERTSSTGEPVQVIVVPISVRSANDGTDLGSSYSADPSSFPVNSGSPASSVSDMPRGFVRAEASLEPVTLAGRRWQKIIGLFTLLALALGGIWAARAAGQLSQPLVAFTRLAEQIASGGRGRRLPRLDVRHPLAPLGNALEAMSEELSRRLENFRRANDVLREASRRLESILAGMGEGVLAVDLEERILFANPAAVTLLDLPRGSLSGRPLLETLRIPAIHQAVEDAITRFEAATNEIDLPRSQTSLAIRASRLPGQPCPGVVLVLHDVSELRRLENMRRDFVSNVSHELKTPLASIQAFTETLIDGAVNDPDCNTLFLRRISEQAERLHNLILDMLRLARIEAGRDVFEIQRLSAAKVIEPCVDEHAIIARTKSVSMTVQPPHEPLRLQADAEGLRTILDNLLDNALNYTPPGGRVTVRWRRERDMAVIEVADTGIGIPRDHLARIFERFHRVDEARSREHGGTGLGLAIVKHLVHVFNGRVEVESQPNAGSTFRVILPLA